LEDQRVFVERPSVALFGELVDGDAGGGFRKGKVEGRISECMGSRSQVGWIFGVLEDGVDCCCSFSCVSGPNLRSAQAELDRRVLLRVVG
jgi:hypothetical protein